MKSRSRRRPVRSGLLLLLALASAACSRDASPLPPLELASVTPTRVSVARSTRLALEGTGLVEGRALGGITAHACGLELTGTSVRGERRSFLVPPAGTIEVTIGAEAVGTLPAGGALGTSDLVLRRADGAQVVLADAIDCVSEESYLDDAPIADDVAASTSEDEAVTLRLSGRDPEGEPVTYAVVEGPSHGELSDLDAAAGSVTYTPDANWHGNDAFTFTASDGAFASEPASVSIAVAPVDDAPRIASFAAERLDFGVGQPVWFTWEATDADGDTIACELDVDGDGTPERTFDPCDRSDGSLWIYSDPTTSYGPILSVRGGPSSTVADPIRPEQDARWDIDASYESVIWHEDGEMNRVSSLPRGGDWVSARVGKGSELGLHSNGTVSAVGAYAGDLPDLEGVVDIAAGGDVLLALLRDGTVVAWGDPTSPATDVPPGLTGVTGIAAGDDFAVALHGDGTLTAWGRNDFGQSDPPAGLDDVTDIAVGHHHGLALTADGTVVAWGKSENGQTDVPPGLTGVTDVVAGFFYSVAVVGERETVAWGGRYSGPDVVADTAAAFTDTLNDDTFTGDLLDFAFGGQLEVTTTDSGAQQYELTRVRGYFYELADGTAGYSIETWRDIWTDP